MKITAAENEADAEKWKWEEAEKRVEELESQMMGGITNTEAEEFESQIQNRDTQLQRTK